MKVKSSKSQVAHYSRTQTPGQVRVSTDGIETVGANIDVTGNINKQKFRIKLFFFVEQNTYFTLLHFIAQNNQGPHMM